MVHQADLISLLRTILIIIVVYYGIKFIFRYLSPYLLKRLINSQKNKYQGSNTHQKVHQEGNVTIKKTPYNRQSSDELGDYVDYEEINDKEE